MAQTNFNDILRLAQDFIAIRSTQDNNKALEEVISLAIRQVPNFTIQHFKRNNKPSVLIHTEKPHTKHFKIILNAHLDVVPGDEDQFSPYIKNDKLFGRGAYDMKTGAAIMILLFKKIAKTVGYPLALQLVTEEEASGHDGTKLQIEKGITADFVIAGESSEFAIKTKAKGVVWMKVTLHGKSSHGAYTWLGDNALQKMVTLVQKLNQAYPTPKISSWQTTINIAKIETPNSTFNKVPDTCTAWIDLRFIPEEEKDIIKNVRKILPLDTDVEIVFNEKPHFTDPDHHFIQQLQKIIQKNTGKKAPLIGAHGTTDLRFYSSLANIPGIEYGPKGGNAHGHNEWDDLKSLEQYYQILKQFLLSVK